MPNNPYDEFMQHIARMVEDMVRNMPLGEGGPRFIGYTIIAGNQGDDSQVIHIGKPLQEEIEYEVIEDEEYLFVTGSLPPTVKGAAYADISVDSVTIVVGERRASIPLNTRIDVVHSYYEIRHGVIDIILKKKKPAANPPL